MQALRIRRLVALVSLTAAVSVYGIAGLGAAAEATPVLLTAGAPATAATSGASAWGDNSAGELGNGTAAASDLPGAVAGVGGIKALAAGNRFTLALLASGAVVAWGHNLNGQLGDGTNIDRDVAVPVKGLTNVSAVAAGGNHSLALLANGTVEAWGDNGHGQLGTGSTTSSATPRLVKGLHGVTGISAGSLHSIALLSDGTVMAWGDNGDGQLGIGTFTNSSLPVAVKGLAGVKQVAAGGRFSLALLADTSVKSWGQGDGGQLGNGTTSASSAPVSVSNLSRVTAIAAGDAHALALLKNGTAQAWGENAFGQLGNPGAPLSNTSDVPIPVQHLNGVTALSAGGLYSVALLKTGAAEAWGDNASGQLGNGTTTDSISPVPVSGLSGVTAIVAGANHAAAIVKPVGAPVQGTPLSIFNTFSTPNPGALPDFPTNVALHAVSAATRTDVWAVGISQPGLTQNALAEHFNGTAWQAVAVPQPARRQASLGGVLDLGPNNAWAVGSSMTGNNDQERTLIEHFDGSAWHIVPSPNPQVGPGGGDRLEAVAGVSATDMWAVGEFFNSSRVGFGIRLLLAHFDGTTWTAVPSPTPSGAFQFARGVTTIAANNAWLVGSQGIQDATLAVHFDGVRWQIVPTPNLKDGQDPLNRLTGVSATGPSNVFASGLEDNVNQQNFRRPYVLHFDGKAWALVLVPNSGNEGSQLNGIAALSAKDFWAVGQTQETDGSILTLTEKFDGTKWSIVPSPDPGELGPNVDSSLDGVASPGGGVVWTVGTEELLGSPGLRTLAMATTSG